MNLLLRGSGSNLMGGPKRGRQGERRAEGPSGLPADYVRKCGCEVRVFVEFGGEFGQGN